MSMRKWFQLAAIGFLTLGISPSRSAFPPTLFPPLSTVFSAIRRPEAR